MKKKTCKHLWTIIPYTPPSFVYSGGATRWKGVDIFNDAIAICKKCLEKRYL